MTNIVFMFVRTMIGLHCYVNIQIELRKHAGSRYSLSKPISSDSVLVLENLPNLCNWSEQMLLAVTRKLFQLMEILSMWSQKPSVQINWRGRIKVD